MVIKLASTKSDKELSDLIVGLAMKVHRKLGAGFVESVYANALSIELTKAEIQFEREKRIPVFYEGHVVGDFVADIVVAEILIVELKAVETLITAHSVQVVNYLNATRVETGLLLNFGAKSLQFKTKTREYSRIASAKLPFPLISSENPVNPV